MEKHNNNSRSFSLRNDLLKMLYSTADNSAVSKDRAVTFALLERAFIAANLANVGFSTCPFTGAPATENRFFAITQPFFNRFYVLYTKMTGLLRPNLPDPEQVNNRIPIAPSILTLKLIKFLYLG
jgi:hypothetical protein